MDALAATTTSYVSRLGDFSRPDGLPDLVEGGGGVRLLVQDAGMPAPEPSSGAGYQAYRAVLHVPGRHPGRVAVEVVLAPWSSARTEVGLRSARRLRPGPDRRYYSAAARAVGALVDQLEGRPASGGPR